MPVRHRLGTAYESRYQSRSRRGGGFASFKFFLLEVGYCVLRTTVRMVLVLLVGSDPPHD